MCYRGMFRMTIFQLSLLVSRLSELTGRFEL